MDASKVAALRTELLNFIRAEGEVHRIDRMVVATLAWIAIFVVAIVVLNVRAYKGGTVRHTRRGAHTPAEG